MVLEIFSAGFSVLQHVLGDVVWYLRAQIPVVGAGWGVSLIDHGRYRETRCMLGVQMST